MREKDAVDKWAAWVLHRCDGDDLQQHAKALEHLLPIRERVLDNARIESGDIVLDVGAGDGLIAFGALDRVGTGGRVITSDVSNDLVSHTQSLAAELGVGGRMSFVQAVAQDLRVIADTSVDVVTTRSVLIYVDDKAAAFHAFHRVLKQGGRVSLFEPINNFFPDSPDEFWGFDTRPVRDLVAKVWEFEGFAESSCAGDPMMNFTEKDLVRYAEDAGFGEVHVELLVDVEPGTWVVDWERLLNTSPNPNARTVSEALRGAVGTAPVAPCVWPSVRENERVISDLSFGPAPAGTTSGRERTFRVLRLRNRLAFELSDIASWDRVRRDLHDATPTEIQSWARPWDRDSFQLHASIR